MATRTTTPARELRGVVTRRFRPVTCFPAGGRGLFCAGWRGG
jgi:hypothetical protein